MNCVKFKTYQCQSAAIVGRNRKLAEVGNKNMAITILGPRLSIMLPIKDPTMPIKDPTNNPNAEKDRDMSDLSASPTITFCKRRAE